MLGTLSLDPSTSNVTSARTLTTYDLATHGTSDCYGGWNDTTQTGWGPAYQNACIHSGETEHSSGSTVWYNYTLASAGTIIDENTTQQNPAANTNTATESLCPKGWTLPTTKQIDNNRSTAEFSPVLGGNYSLGTLYNEDTRGYWWGSTAYYGARRYYLFYNGSSLYTGNRTRHDGLYIRCVSEEKTVTDLTYMQDMTKAISDATPEGTTAGLTDRRDGKLYQVAKINGNMWMTQNLRLGYDSTNAAATSGISSLTLTPDDSNIVLDSNRINPTTTHDEVTDGYRELTTYDLITYGKNTAGSNQCYGSYSSASQTGWGPAYQYNCIHSGTIASLGDLPTSWYNYTLASAGTIIDENATQQNPATNTDAATESICPKGWTLPNTTQTQSIGPSSGSSIYVSVFLPVFGGYYANSTLNNENTQGYWWTSTASNVARRYSLRFSSSILYTSGSNRYSGYPIRCVQAS